MSWAQLFTGEASQRELQLAAAAVESSAQLLECIPGRITLEEGGRSCSLGGVRLGGRKNCT